MLAALGALLLAGVLAAALLAGTTSDEPPRRVKETVTLEGTTIVETVTTAAAPTTDRPTTEPTTTPEPRARRPSPSRRDRPAELNDHGFALMQAGDYEGALPLLEQAVAGLAGSGETAEAYASYNLAFTRLALGSCDGVLDLLDRSEQVQGERKEITRLRREAERSCDGDDDARKPRGGRRTASRSTSRYSPDLIGSHQLAVGEVPGDRLGDALLERLLRLPAERAQLGRVERVAAVVAGAVLDVADQRLVGARQPEDVADDLDVLALVVAADVVDLARRALPQHELDPGAVVLDPEPVADLLPVAVDRQRLAVERVRRQQRDQLLRVLVRPVGVRAARDRGVDAERPHVRGDVQVAAGLRDAVRARRLERIGLDRGAAGGEVAVDLVGRDLDEAGAAAAHLLEQHLGAEELRPAEVGRAEDRAVDVRLGREVDDRVAAGGRLRDRLRVADVADDELDRPVPSRFAGLPEYVSLSSTRTSSPAARSRLAKWEPMKPAPPVTSTRIAKQAT